jgi:hypothetical protein
MKHLSLFLGCLITVTGFAAELTPAGKSYALLVGGLAGQEPYQRWYRDWVARCQSYLVKEAGVPAANIVTLADKAATAKAITGALRTFADRLQPQDQFILFIVGHGEITGRTPTLTLAGPDLTAVELAAALDRLPARNQVVLNFSASSGDFLKPLAAPGRINLTATSPTETEEPVFAEFFLRGLESKRAAGSNGVVTVRDAFNWSAQQTALWIARWEQSGANTWKAAGKETVAIFEKLYAGMPSRKLDAASNRTVEDEPVAIQPPNGVITAAWKGRRVIDEHALIEDCGQPLGVSVLGEKGLQPVAGEKPMDPGYLAGRTVLGQPARTNP